MAFRPATRVRTRSIVAALLGAIAIAALAAGCYRHVVRESGPGSREDVHEPNLKETPIDKVIYGDE